jgi:AcrR family transcriptional regulator
MNYHSLCRKSREVTVPAKPHQQQRVDAVRNRARIMAAAGEQITLHGPDVGMNAIAAAAGVAVGTLYRNFPTKAELVGAVVNEYVHEMVLDVEATVARVEAGSPALTEIHGVTSRFIEASAQNHAVKAAAHVLGAADYGPLEQRAFAAIDRLVTLARDAGVLRADASTEDFALLLTTAPSDQPPATRARWLALFLDGMTAGAPGRRQS